MPTESILDLNFFLISSKELLMAAQNLFSHPLIFKFPGGKIISSRCTDAPEIFFSLCIQKIAIDSPRVSLKLPATPATFGDRMSPFLSADYF